MTSCEIQFQVLTGVAYDISPFNIQYPPLDPPPPELDGGEGGVGVGDGVDGVVPPPPDVVGGGVDDGGGVVVLDVVDVVVVEEDVLLDVDEVSLII